MTNFQDISDRMVERVLSGLREIQQGLRKGDLSAEDARSQSGLIAMDITLMLTAYPECEQALSEDQYNAMQEATREVEYLLSVQEAIEKTPSTTGPVC